MQQLAIGFIFGWLGHYTYVWLRRRTIFHTTSYTTNSGKTSYVSYTWPKRISFKSFLPFVRTKAVYARKGRRK